MFRLLLLVTNKRLAKYKKSPTYVEVQDTLLFMVSLEV